ncbi:MAG: NUDIX domain-containing protein [Patescibacteria group bacterium]
MEQKILKIKRQIVAGFVIYRRTEEGIKFLFLYRRGNYWNFPKGHFEAGENSFRAALRETEEETGLRPADLRIIPNFKAHLRFSFLRGDEKIHDKMILYLAETRKGSIIISPREHNGFAWFSYNDAIKIIGKRYGNTKKVLKEAYDFVQRKSVPNNQKNSQR